jgi:N-acetyl sugar amidotransferase
MIAYCVMCLLPDTKPDLSFNDSGRCSACSSFLERPHIDWAKREHELEEILRNFRRHDGSNWDCVVPVSGGKDSTYQVIKVLQHGMTPLAVTATTCDLSEIGRRNIRNLQELGVDHLSLSPNPKVRAQLNRVGLEQVGDISWPEHVGIFTIPIRAAVAYDVPLIIWGENSQNEYGGPAAAAGNSYLDRRWLEEFGGLLGLRVDDLPSTSGISERDLIPYRYPTDDELRRVGVTGLFLGYFVPWDGYSNALVAQAKGLQTFGSPVEGTPVDYENLDNHQTGIHDYFKYLKYGFGRTTDIISLHLRRGRLSRKDALEIVIERDGRFPWTYLGKHVAEILRPLGLTVEEFQSICDIFTNHELFETDSQGRLKRRADGSPIKTNFDNPE